MSVVNDGRVVAAELRGSLLEVLACGTVRHRFHARRSGELSRGPAGLVGGGRQFYVEMGADETERLLVPEVVEVMHAVRRLEFPNLLDGVGLRQLCHTGRIYHEVVRAAEQRVCRGVGG